MPELLGGGCGAGPDGRQPPQRPYDPGGGRDHGPGSGEGQIKRGAAPIWAAPDIKFDMIFIWVILMLNNHPIRKKIREALQLKGGR